MKLDAHQHFWRYTPEEYGWIGEEMAILKKDHLPGDLAPLIRAEDIAGTVAVQARQSLAETEWLLGLAGRNDLIRGVVGWVDLRSPTVGAQLERFSAHPKLRGIRHVLQDEPDDRFMLREDFQRGLAQLRDFELAYDLLVFPRQLPAAAELVGRFPKQPFVLDHIGKPSIKDRVISPWEEDIRRLADFPNVTCKVSGMVTEADWSAWQAEDFRPYLDIVFEAFGPERIMFGSDWPVCTVAGSYASVAALVREYIQALPAAGQAAVLGGTAARFYRL